MYSLIVIFYATVFAVGPDTDGHPTRNLAVPPTASQSTATLGTYDTEPHCKYAGESVPAHKSTAYTDVEAVPFCLFLKFDDSAMAER